MNCSIIRSQISGSTVNIAILDTLVLRRYFQDLVNDRHSNVKVAIHEIVDDERNCGPSLTCLCWHR